MNRQSCIKCHKVPMDILVLQCNHGLCVECSYNVCDRSKECIVCPRCRRCTYLEEQIIREIYGSMQVDVDVCGGGDRIGIYREGKQYEKNGYAMKGNTVNNNDMTKTKHINSYDNKWQRIQGRQRMQGRQTYKSNKSTNNYSYSNNIASSLQCTATSLVNNPNKSKPSNQIPNNYAHPIHSMHVNHQKQYTSPSPSHHSPSSYPSFSSHPPSSYNCKQHPQYQLLYICKNCNHTLICPQCIINGTHKHHQVQSIKKLISKIQAQLSSKIYSLNCSIQGLIQVQKDKQIQLQNKINKIYTLKQQAIDKYMKIREQLDRQQVEIVGKCDKLMEEYENGFKDVQEWIKQDLIGIQSQKDYISKILNTGWNVNGNGDGRNICNGDPQNKKIMQINMVQQYLNYLNKNNNNKMDNKWINGCNTSITGKKLNQKKQKQQKQKQNQNSLEILTDRIKQIKIPNFISTTIFNGNGNCYGHGHGYGTNTNTNFNTNANANVNGDEGYLILKQFYDGVKTKGSSLAGSRNKQFKQQKQKQKEKDKQNLLKYSKIIDTTQHQQKQLKNSRIMLLQTPFNTLKMSMNKQNILNSQQAGMYKGSRMKESRTINTKNKILKSQQQNNFIVF